MVVGAGEQIDAVAVIPSMGSMRPCSASCLVRLASCSGSGTPQASSAFSMQPLTAFDRLKNAVPGPHMLSENVLSAQP